MTPPQDPVLNVSTDFQKKKVKRGRHKNWGGTRQGISENPDIFPKGGGKIKQAR